MKSLILSLAVFVLIVVLPTCELHAGPRGGSVGIVVEVEGDRAVVKKVKSGLGADRSGISEGDIIIAIDGMPVAGRSTEEIQKQLNGTVGSEVSITLLGSNGADRVAFVIRESLIEPSDPGLPVNLGLPKPHDLRPEDGMVCKIKDITGGLAIIDCGKNAGVDRGQHVRFINRKNYGKTSSITSGRVTKVDQYTSKVAVNGSTRSLMSDDVVAVTAAWRSERARENTLWRVTAHGIKLLDYPSGLPYATIEQLRFDADLKLEKAAVTKMAERISESADVARSIYRGRISKGKFSGKSLASALKQTDPQDVMAFLKFLNTYPDNYVGRDWFLPEVYATWILNGTPHYQ